MTFAGETLAARSSRLGRTGGFDALRLGLALGIFLFHSFTISHGNALGMTPALAAAAKLIVPGFFALSGYLVAASLARSSSVSEFALLRALRIVPALCVVVAVSSLLLGPLMTSHSLRGYFQDAAVPAYFRNIFGHSQFALPGVFENNPRSGIVNGSLWTIQLEMLCYGFLGMAALLLRGRALAWALAVLCLLLLFPLTPFAGLLLAWLPAKELPLAFTAGALLFHIGRHLPHHGAIGMACLALAYAMALKGWAWAPLPLAYGIVWLALHPMPALRADYSYGIYLISYPVQQSWVQLFPGQAAWWQTLLFALPITVLAAAALWRWVEQPVLRRKRMILAHVMNAGRVAQYPLRSIKNPAGFLRRGCKSLPKRGAGLSGRAV